MGRLTYTEAEAREAIAASRSWAEALRRLGMCSTGNAWRILKKHAATWNISTLHFDPRAALVEAQRQKAPALADVLVPGSTYKRATLKRRLYAEGLKERRCELCGQDEFWRGSQMALILDHINGVSNDNRLENLRIICPNCAATLDTHCGRNRRLHHPRACERCGETFQPKRGAQRFCSQFCGVRSGATGPRPQQRKVARPPLDQLLAEVDELGFSAVGRKYGVSDNAVRKWLRSAGVEPPRRAGRHCRRVEPAGEEAA
ncbi:MAG TPA: HNH endonuclease [Baekduia sp.]|nr:HNH endonuclease [Baekduia sp.]